jgi:dTDP-4-amino-4,6-dideoxygalactose transaminase
MIDKSALSIASRMKKHMISNALSCGESIPMLDVVAGNAPLQADILAAIESVCRSGKFIGGPQCREFEQQIAQYCRTNHAVGCASGSDALLLALMACDLEPGDEVIVPSFTFFATASAVWRLGATPVFVDIEPATFGLDAAKIEDHITEYTKAIIPVHLFGQCCDMQAISDIAASHGLHVIEDAAQSIGAQFDGRMAGSMGDIGCFSFYPTKNLGGYGDGGMMTCTDDDLAQRLRLLANHGMAPRYYHSEVGVNSRLDSIQATVLQIKLAYLDRWTQARRENAARYQELFAGSTIGAAIELPAESPQCVHVWNQFTVRIKHGWRDLVRQKLADAQIGSEIYYPVPLHRQACFATLDNDPDCLPETEAASAEVLSLPIYPELTPLQQERIVGTLESIVDGCRRSVRRAA